MKQTAFIDSNEGFSRTLWVFFTLFIQTKNTKEFILNKNDEEFNLATKLG